MIKWTNEMLQEKKIENQANEIEEPSLCPGIVGELIEEIFCARALEVDIENKFTKVTEDMESWKAAYYRSEGEKQPGQDKIRSQNEKIKRLERQMDAMKDERNGRERRRNL